jgi:hypothetical protein
MQRAWAQKQAYYHVLRYVCNYFKHHTAASANKYLWLNQGQVVLRGGSFGAPRLLQLHHNQKLSCEIGEHENLLKCSANIYLVSAVTSSCNQDCFQKLAQ